MRRVNLILTTIRHSAGLLFCVRSALFVYVSCRKHGAVLRAMLCTFLLACKAQKSERSSSHRESRESHSRPWQTRVAACGGVITALSASTRRTGLQRNPSMLTSTMFDSSSEHAATLPPRRSMKWLLFRIMSGDEVARCIFCMGGLYLISIAA